MACLIVVSSRGGNTKKVAEALAQGLAAAQIEVEGPVEPGAVDDEVLAAADTVLAGFWTDKGYCAPELASLLERLAGKRVFLFGTAGFGGSASYFERILGNVQQHLPADAVLVGTAMCQGKMAPGVRARYEAMLAENPEDGRARAMLANFDAASTHPSDEDCAAIVSAALQAL